MTLNNMHKYSLRKPQLRKYGCLQVMNCRMLKLCLKGINLYTPQGKMCLAIYSFYPVYLPVLPLCEGYHLSLTEHKPLFNISFLTLLLSSDCFFYLVLVAAS